MPHTFSPISSTLFFFPPNILKILSTPDCSSELQFYVYIDSCISTGYPLGVYQENNVFP